LTVGSGGQIQGRLVRRHPEQFTKFRDAGEYFLIPVKSVTTVRFEGDVFNLEVEEEHSYLVGFCAVKNCQNYVTSQALRDPVAGVPPETVTPTDIVEAAVRRRARILTSTYNEPLITSEWAVEIFREAKARGLVCSFVSNGNATAEVLEYLRPWVDLYKVDLKGFDDRRYRKLGGVLQNILESIQLLHVEGFWLEVVTLVVPGFNDSDAELRDLAQFLASVSRDIPWHVTAFHADYKMLDHSDTSAATLLRAAELGLAAGLRYVYAGNLPGRVGPFENTWCPTCRGLLIERTGFTVHRDRLTPSGGACPDCGTLIPGRWR
jgi:pyruvate formate lyase activating enzyme